MMTPSEMLMYTAELKHPIEHSKAEKIAHVAYVIAQLGLQDCQDTVIGTLSHRGISGGEAKRVNIGIALITSPKVLLTDELTSGLDSFTAHEVVEVVKGIASQGITTVASIHSPPPYTFELFDKLVLLQKGRVVYFGSNGDAVCDYFGQAFPSLRSMRRTEGIADYLLDVTTRANREVKQAAAFADAYQVSELCAENRRVIDDSNRAFVVDNKPAPSPIHSQPLPSSREVVEDVDEESGGGLTVGGGGCCGCRTLAKGSSWSRCSCPLPSFVSGGDGTDSATVTPMWWALIVLWRYRSVKAYRRSDFIAPRLFDKVMIVFLVVTLWWRIGSSLPTSAGSVSAILFLWSMLTAFTSMGILPTIVLERPVYTRERSDGLYLPITYCVYKITEELVPQIPAGLAYSALVFYLVDLGGSFLLFWLVYLVSTANAIAMTFLVSACSSNTSVAGAFLSSYATTLFFFSGFLIPYPQIVKPWKWYPIIDPLRYSFGAMMANQFGPNDPPYIGGKTVLSYFGLKGVDAWRWLGFEALFFIVYTGFLWLALSYWKHQRR